jgi:hypothetical protein
MTMGKKFNIFEKVILEADEAPPDIGGAEPQDTAPDIAEDPPDLSVDTNDNMPEVGFDDTPPEVDNDDNVEDFDMDSEDNEEDPQNLQLDEKISAIMNMNLYQRFLTLLNKIGTQLAMIKNNSDILSVLSTELLDIIESLKKLDENIRLYLNNYFINENYSSNLLFYNKCINLLKLLNDIFDKNINKGIKQIG